jgi:hypothetical protein
MPNRHEERLAELVDWLSEPENPSVRYLTLRHLLDKAEDEPAVQAARSAIAQSRPVNRVMARQTSAGCWGDPESPYLHKYKASYWTLMVLGYLHVSRENGGVQKAVEHLLRFQQPCGGFAESGQAGARREYEIVARRRRAGAKNLPGEDAFVPDYIHQMTLSCLTGNVAAALLRLEYADDPTIWRAIDWLVRIQNADGGWLCPYWKAHIKDTHSCFYGTICPLEAFAEIPAEKRSPEVQEAVSRGVEFLLMHRLYKADHHDFAVINPNWLKLAFPWFYRYDILRGLWVLARLGFRDERMDDALEALREKQTIDGRWVLESTPSGRMLASFGKKGEPNKWITLHALWVLKEMNHLRALE